MTKFFLEKMQFSCIFGKKTVPLHTFLKKMATKNDKTGKPSPVNHAMVYGLEMGIFFGLNFILSAKAQDSAWLNILSWLLTIYIIYGVFRSAFNYRMTECDGEITFGQSFKYIMYLFFFASIVAALIRIVYLKWFDTEFLSRMLTQSRLVLQQFRLSASDLATTEDSIMSLLRPVRFSLYYIIYDMLMGLLTALILSPLVKKKINIENQQ